MRRPRVAITLGDPAGIGPEIVARAMAAGPAAAAAECVAFGDARVLTRAIGALGLELGIRAVPSASGARFEEGVLDVVDLADADPAAFEPGVASALCGRAAWEGVSAAVAAALSGEVDAVATAPINKEAVRAAGLPYIGHTEMLAALTGARDPLTMFETHGLRIFFLTRHVALRDVPAAVTRERLRDYIGRCVAALGRMGLGDGELAVAGLNPHCGEHGLFGDEEDRVIAPAVEEARALGLKVSGPVGADSVFHLAKSGRYAAVLSLYHDQGHIAAKTLDFERTISLTLGLPFLRASVDHGTAFDIAWKGRASAAGMEESVIAASRYAWAWAGPS